MKYHIQMSMLMSLLYIYIYIYKYIYIYLYVYIYIYCTRETQLISEKYIVFKIKKSLIKRIPLILYDLNKYNIKYTNQYYINM